MAATHEVTNQVPPLVGHDVAEDPALLEGLRGYGAGWAEAELHDIGTRAGSAQAQEWGRLANENPPLPRTHDRYGHRIDEVEFHPHWHDLTEFAIHHGMHATAWRDERAGAHLARAAKFLVWGQVDAGHLCPISMTYVAVPALRTEPGIASVYEPLLASTTYDFGLREPVGKRGLIAGMSMTEKQGGSDVRANTTTARPNADGSYSVTGHKWFTSAPMSDIFLTPALGWRIGAEGRGVNTIIQMVNLTRLDCTLVSASGMRYGVVRAVHHARHRKAFGARLVEQPLMTNVLADLIIESEAAMTVSLRLAGAVDKAQAGDEHEALLRRIGVAVSKYWVCKRAPMLAAEALECLGGNGYVEESGMPRLFRESPLPSIWEGSGNVSALDSLRAMAKQPESVEAYFAEVDKAAFDDALSRLRKDLGDLDDAQYRARRIVESMAIVLQGSLLLRTGHPAVADAFCASRCAGDRGNAFGTLPSGVDTAAIVYRA